MSSTFSNCKLKLCDNKDYNIILSFKMAALQLDYFFNKTSLECEIKISKDT